MGKAISLYGITFDEADADWTLFERLLDINSNYTGREALVLALEPPEPPPAPVTRPAPRATPRGHTLPANTPATAPVIAPKRRARPKPRRPRRKSKPKGRGMGWILTAWFIFLAAALVAGFGLPVFLFFKCLGAW